MKDDDGMLWLYDGWLTLAAAISNDAQTIVCDVLRGDRRAALLASASVNAEHGLRRTGDDKARAVRKLLLEMGTMVGPRDRTPHPRLAHLRHPSEKVTVHGGQ
jgi:hypothetical protein